MSTSAGSAHDGADDDYDRRHIRHHDIDRDQRDHLLEREKEKFGA